MMSGYPFFHDPSRTMNMYLRKRCCESLVLTTSYQVGRLLAVEGSLILEPLPVSMDTLDLLAIVVGHRVGCARVGRVDTVLLDLPNDPTVEQVEHLPADARSDQPADARRSEGQYSQAEDGIEWDHGDQWLAHGGRQHRRASGESNETRGRAEGKLNAAAAHAR